MNNLKKTGGFTLVELIVVIAILGILAAVAAPAYSGYLKKANQASDDQAIASVNTAISAALSMEGEDGSDATTYFTVATGTNKVTISEATVTGGNEVWDNFVEFYGLTSTATTVDVTFDYYSGATMTNGIISGTEPT